jgi:mono/diheme cytochrome c family protein
MRWIYGVSLSLALGTGAVLAGASEPAPAAGPKTVPQGAPRPEALREGERFFEAKIRPLFAQHCLACHGEKAQKGGLRLDLAAGLRKGGDSGPAVVAGDPQKSPLLQAIQYDGPVRMPPQGKLKPQQLEDLATWIRMDAPWPEYGDKGKVSEKSQHPTPNTQRPYWSFVPVKPLRVPAVKNKAWAKSPIDAFVLAKLEAKGLQPSPQASKRELIRRAYFDVLGLPPSPEDVERFLNDTSPDAYEKLIDQLLARPQFGERWGRHWLDVVRYAQTNGYERDDEKPEAWRYRDYVIHALNADKPYDQFIKEQLAGDELSPVTDASITATGFYRIGVWDDEPDDLQQAEFDNLDDMLSTTSQAFMALTVGCARCHDHKFDPIAQDDYYGMLAFIRNVKRYEVPDPKVANPPIFTKLSNGERTLAISEYGATPKKTQILIRGNAATPSADVVPHFITALSGTKEAAIPKLAEPAPHAGSTGRRRVLADWIASPAHPLTSRVMVNRIWQHLFGRGLVATPNDFGHTGLTPTHPELLDWLAAAFSGVPSSEFRVSGSPSAKGNAEPETRNPEPAKPWSVKQMIRRIMLSSTYRQSSRIKNARAATVDPANQLLWRQNLRRMEAEAIRDAILATSGKLNLKMGGQGIYPVLPPEVLSTQSRPGAGWGTSSEEERGRRSVYIFIKRTLGVPFLESFDATTPDSPVGARPVTTIAPQALILLNSAFMDEQSAAFAARLLKEDHPDATAQVERAYRLALGRRPTEREAAIARAYLDRQRQAAGKPLPELEAERRALSAFCKVVLNLNEFIYID